MQVVVEDPCPAPKFTCLETGACSHQGCSSSNTALVTALGSGLASVLLPGSANTNTLTVLGSSNPYINTTAINYRMLDTVPPVITAVPGDTLAASSSGWVNEVQLGAIYLDAGRGPRDTCQYGITAVPHPSLHIHIFCDHPLPFPHDTLSLMHSRSDAIRQRSTECWYRQP